jgi:hypothetical protein
MGFGGEFANIPALVALVKHAVDGNFWLAFEAFPGRRGELGDA